MRKVFAVVGANLGDEGKGLRTDYLSNSNTLVVRFNSGAQAGHTVETPDGSRHVFHHFGSGSFRGASTFLSPYFAVSPMFFQKELADLLSKGLQKPKVFIDPRCRVTTPYDIMLNQAVEQKRGNNRHGSCGMGFSETIERSRTHELTVHDLLDPSWLRYKLQDIRNNYVPLRIQELGIETPEFLYNDRVLERFISDCGAIPLFAKIRFWYELAETWPYDIVFEGAQGLLLDMDNEQFPHVTRSKTGLTNVAALCKEADIKEPVDVSYMTRSYLTRHGAGPMDNEFVVGKLPYKNVVDKTNIHNDHQGSLRFAYLDLDRLTSEINRDIACAKRAGIDVRPNIVMTCADQVDDNCVWYYAKTGGNLRCATPLDFVKIVMEMTGAKTGAFSYGPTRTHMSDPIK